MSNEKLRRISVYETPARQIIEVTETEMIGDTEFFAIIVNTMEGYFRQYSEGLVHIVIASQKCAKRERSGQVLLSPEQMNNVLSGVRHQLDNFYNEVAMSDFSKPLRIVVPFHILTLAETETDPEKHIDTAKSSFYVNGLIYEFATL